ncbi:hypothetical protein MMC07_006683 [Pseudocyphellaria aurata]|nr:hypothetical protein [Pseudocyphellaria aurata]
MPITRVTVALNSKQSQKAPLLIPSSATSNPSAPLSCREYVIKTAVSKLRLKKASRVFIAGGRELLEQQDWEEALKDDVVFLVSAGEGYVGAKKERCLDDEKDGQNDRGPSAPGNPDCSINILAENALIDAQSIAQLTTTARTLPGIVHAVAQPDLHPGTRFPIGAVFVSEGWIHPPLIGGDIGCGMAWYKTKLSRSNVEGVKGQKLAEKLRGLEGAWRTQQDREIWLRANTGEERNCSAGEAWDMSLGTIGAGNHFAEVQVVEKVEVALDHIGIPRSQHLLYEGEVVLLVHSGSRGYGGDILKRYTATGLDSIHEADPLASQYLQEHNRACAWAARNRDLIALRFLACLEPGDESWGLGINIRDSELATVAEHILTARTNVQARKVVDIYHNNVEVTFWPPQPPASCSAPELQKRVFIHRKGAAPTHSPTTQVPLSILPLPGSRATPTLILHPAFSSATRWGYSNALSLAHGAGRAMSRAKAASYVAQKYKGKSEDLLRGDFMRADRKGNKHLDGQGKSGEGGQEEHVVGGTWVVCEDKQLVWEEAPDAYKDVWDVAGDLVTSGAAENWGWCRGRVSYKVRKE